MTISTDAPLGLGKLRGWFWFATLQLAIVVAGIVWARHYISQQQAERLLPPLRDVPAQVVPRRDVAEVVSDEQLRAVLTRLIPRRETTARRINHVDHALRLWGTGADFSDRGGLKGEQLRDLLLDHRRFAACYGADARSLLILAEAGLAVRVKEGDASSSHHDHTLACLAEVGTTLQQKVIAPGHETTVREMVEQSLRSFRLNQREYEWTAVVAALYLADSDGWTTAEGQRVTFDRLARRMMREELPEGVCWAHHRMHGLVVLLRVDEEKPILSCEVRAEVTRFLRGVTAVLVANQHPEGYWDLDWAGHQSPAADQPETLADRILATGHPLEWWALAPDEVLPPRSVVVAAGQWLARTVGSLSDEEVQDYYTYLTHAGRALALWRGTEAAQVALEPAEVTRRPSARYVFKDSNTLSAPWSRILSALPRSEGPDTAPGEPIRGLATRLAASR